MSSRGAGFYFPCAVVVIGVFGTAANGHVLYELVASKQHRKHVLICNQNLLDLVCCFFLSIMYGTKLANVYLEGVRGYWLCLTLLSEGPAWGPFVGSAMNLSIRLLLNAKWKLHNWTIFSAVAFVWIFGIAVATGVTVATTNVVDGVCYTHWFSGRVLLLS